MDEATKLVSDLQFKLAELDHKVYRYQRDMVSEFDKYVEGLLRDVSKDVSETVSRTIKEKKKLYRSLYPEADAPVESCAIGSSSSTSLIRNGLDANRPPQHTTLTRPISTPFRRPEEEEEGLPRSPHEREKEFQGLFTPRYLPLLDDPSRTERRSSKTYEKPFFPIVDTKDKQKEVDIMQVDTGTDTRSLTSSPQVTRPPTPKRRNTDELSIKSDWSDGTVRRSALRRSSSISKGHHSPRRVRFEFEGEEVLPTSSPVALRSPIGDLPGLSFAEENEEEAGLEQIEDVDEEPAPKRVSSSQALRALSRSPLDDDGTQWTTVTAPPDGSASVATTNIFSSESSSEDLQNSINDSSSESTPRAVQISNGTSQHGSGGNSAPPMYARDEPETPSDDEMLDIMTPLRRQSQSPASMLSPAVPANIEDNKSPTASTRSTGAAWKDLQSFGGQQKAIRDDDLIFDDDQEVMFNFDEHVASPYKPEPLPEEESSESEPELLIKSRKSNSQPSSYSRSPAREIIRPNPNVVPATTGIVGSYKGRPFSMPVVDKDLHDQAASMGDFTSFVGSTHERVDAGDTRSFSRSGGFGSYSGTPRSMSERLMLDDIMEAEENKRPRNGGRA